MSVFFIPVGGIQTGGGAKHFGLPGSGARNILKNFDEFNQSLKAQSARRIGVEFRNFY